MSGVRSLREVQLEPDPEMVAALEAILERAKKGDLLGFAIAMHTRGDETATQYSTAKGGNVAHLVCAIERLKLRLLGA